jgi:hypothetical protein
MRLGGPRGLPILAEVSGDPPPSAQLKLPGEALWQPARPGRLAQERQGVMRSGWTKSLVLRSCKDPPRLPKMHTGGGGGGGCVQQRLRVNGQHRKGIAELVHLCNPYKIKNHLRAQSTRPNG